MPRLEDVFDGASHLVTPVAGIDDRYVDAVLGWRAASHPGPTPRVAYTPLHGVGGPLCVRLLAAGGHESVVVVSASRSAVDDRFKSELDDEVVPMAVPKPVTVLPPELEPHGLRSRASGLRHWPPRALQPLVARSPRT